MNSLQDILDEAKEKSERLQGGVFIDSMRIKTSRIDEIEAVKRWLNDLAVAATIERFAVITNQMDSRIAPGVHVGIEVYVMKPEDLYQLLTKAFNVGLAQ